MLSIWFFSGFFMTGDKRQHSRLDPRHNPVSGSVIFKRS